MKLLISALVISGAAAFAPSMGGRSMTSLDASVVYYSTSTGNTETVAQYIADAAGNGDIQEIGDASESEVAGFDGLIIGAPTWHTGADEQRSGTSWDDFLYDTLPNIELEGKNVAVFGMGDQEGYGDNYCDAAGELYDLFEAKGCKMFGLTSTDGYNHSDSKAERDGKFCGLMMDEDNQYDLSEDRAKAWVEQLKSEGFAF
uniref:Flavodoxin-like domain-containing protein n=1 Tax=Chaetoceros debilis TaxID=122233 RepID=A0A7S3Q5G7_9STRA|eukprot:CAMPEP_0194086278 /NCGR_PEP_ID=MMETSP0149-20130528/20520_1 /TAXON_ID=122233 /ORGANISM="Chaetoceros debilis, Strain MM31A-1" /LENGTH=200 /DNA_ID=CAMNT_0038769335 /DNA_START=38 /DNA_END=640 /DNA_ORIENTATION=+